MNKQNGIDSQLAYVKYSDFNRYDICIYDFNSNTSTNLTLSNQSISGNFDPRWSPDGQYIAWSAKQGRNRQLWIMDADGQNAYLTGAEGDIEVPKWSPDGKKIAYTTANKINLYDLKTDMTTCLKHTNASSNNFLWSPDSQSVAYVTVFEDFFYLTIGSTVDDRVRRVEKGSFGGIVWPKKDVLYFEGGVIGRQGEGDNICSLSLDGQANFLMPLDAAQHSIVRIAPDAKQIAYFSFIPIPLDAYTAHPDGKGSLHISDINGQNHKQILSETSPGEIIWSRHQTKLAWEANRSGQIYTIDLMSLETRVIGEKCGDVAWRP